MVEGEGAAEPEVIGKGKKEDEEGGEPEKGKEESRSSFADWRFADCRLRVASVGLQASKPMVNQKLAIGNRQSQF